MANTIDFNVSTNAVNVLNQTGAAAENTAKGFTSAKAELRALNQQLLQMDASSEEFKVASKRAAELKDNISDLSAEINANAGNAFEGLSNNVGLFGSRLMDLDLKGAGQALTGMGSAVARIDFKTLKEEVGGLVGGFMNLAKAILANPILLLGAAIAAVAMNMDKLRQAIPNLDSALGGLTEKMKAAAKANEAALKARQLEYDLINASTALMKEQGMSDKDILKAQIEKAKALLEQKKITDAQNIANAKADLQRNENLKLVLKGIQEVGLAVPKLMAYVFDTIFAKAKELLSYVGVTIDTSVQAYDTIVGAQSMVLDAIFGNTAEQVNAIKEMEDQALLSQRQLENSIAQMGLDLNKTNKNNVEKFKEEYKEVIDTAAEEFRSAYNAISDLAKQQTKENELRLLSEKDRELQINKEKYDALIAEADLRGIDTKVFLDAQLAEEDAIKKKWADKEKQQAEDLAKAKLEAEKQLYEARWGLATASVNLLGTLFAKNKKAADVAFALDKGLAVAKIIVDTQAEIAGYYAANAAAGPAGMAVASAQALAAKIRAATSIATIAGTTVSKFMNGGGSAASGTTGGTGGGGTQAPSPANFAFLGNQPNQQPPLQAYVVSGQVSSNLEAQQLINNQARLGG